LARSYQLKKHWPKSRFLVNSLQRSPRHRTLGGSSRTKPSLCIKISNIFYLKPSKISLGRSRLVHTSCRRNSAVSIATTIVDLHIRLNFHLNGIRLGSLAHHGGINTRILLLYRPQILMLHQENFNNMLY
jgi:hypothetical protein